MNVLEVEQAKVAVLQAPDLLLLPGSLVMEELVRRGGRGPRRLTLSLTFASAEVRLLVTLAKPLDLVVLNPAILPPSALDPLFLEVDETTSLVYLLRGVREAMRQHQESQLSDGLLAHIPSSLAHLGEVCPGLAHELAVQGTRTTLLLKFVPEQAIALASVAALLKADRLEAAEHHYLLKLVFEQGAFLPEEWAVQFSPALAAMLPELQAVRVAGLGQAGNSQETLVEFLANTRQQVEGRLVRAVEAWEERARVMAPLLDAFLGGEEALAYPDLDTMARLDLVFRTETRVHLYTVTLGTGDSRGHCRVEFSAKREAAGGKLARLRAAPKLEQEKYSELRPGDIDLEEGLLDQLFTWMDESVNIDARK